jgi:uncharacterized protein
MTPARRTLILLLIAWIGTAAAPATRPIAWQDWSNDLFAQAQREHKFVLLDLGTRWCHWCHVMENTTYADPDVAALIFEKYIPVHVDADSRPDFYARYQDYGWPATIVFNSDGSEIVKRRGYLDPNQMASMLRAIIADPTPGPSVVAEQPIEYSSATSLNGDLRKKLLAIYSDTYDWDQGSWGRGQKFLEWNSVEWAMRRAASGDKTAEKMARQTLDAQLNLLDPAWGGVYQYSTDDDWQHPHFEKIMQMQAENLRIYSLAYSQFHDPKYLHAAGAIHGFLTNFLLGADGAFYTSQDADLVDGVHSADYFKLSDKDRRSQGIPRIDMHQYARENGWAIDALAFFYEATGDQSALTQATTATNWVIANRSAGSGGFNHDAQDAAGPYLGDTLAMGRAFLELYVATGDRAWLKRAEQAADFISAHFLRSAAAGLVASDTGSGPLAPRPEFDENVVAARWANLLAQFTGRAADRQIADAAMKFVSTPQLALNHGIQVAGLLLADNENSSPAVHIVIVGKKSDPAAAAMFRFAAGIPTAYRRLEWYDSTEGPLLNMDVDYPDLGKAAAFLCTGTACSSPAFTTEQLATRAARALRMSSANP